MKFTPLTLIVFAVLAFGATPTNVTGTWKLLFAGPPELAPKTVHSIVLNLRVEGNTVQGTAHVGLWPGDAPIDDGRIDGDRITFMTTGRYESTTGKPTCKFVVTVRGEEMSLTMAAIKNPWDRTDPRDPAKSYEYRGKRDSK